MIRVVQIRIVAPDAHTAELAIAGLKESVGSARIALQQPHQGRRGSEYLTYGTLQIDDATTLTIEAPTPAVTGPTTRRAATGKTRKLRRT